MPSPSETHIRALIAPLFEKGDGLAFFGSAFLPDTQWTINSVGEPGSGSHPLSGTYKGLEEIGNVFWRLECLFDIERKAMKLTLVDVIASDVRAVVTLVTTGKTKSGEDMVSGKMFTL